MYKKLFFAGIALVSITGTTLFLIPWGNYESNLEKSELTKVENDFDSSGVVLPSLDDLYGIYHVESGEGNIAEILFKIDGLKNTVGAFEEFSIDFDIKDSFALSNLDVVIQAASVNTENATRDESLVSQDFFHVAKFPTIEYHAEQIEFKNSVYTAKGELTLMGTTKTLEVPFKHVGSGRNKNKVDFEAFEGEFEFDRTQYGMVEEAGVGNIVKISFYCEMVLESTLL